MSGKATNPALALGLWLIVAWAQAATPHLELNVQLDPHARRLQVHAHLSGLDAPVRIALAPELRLQRVSLNGRPWPTADRPALDVPAGGRVTLVYGGRLPPMPQLDHRGVLGELPAAAGPEGSYLPAAGAWYPHPGRPFTYRLRLHLPAGQKGLVPGNRVQETDGPAGYSATYDFPHPAEGIDLMAGPYVTDERSLSLDDGRRVRLRTWFYREERDLAADYLQAASRAIERYSRLIGPYPYTDFGIVASPLPTGFGMPSLTYLGRGVLRLPFIRTSSLPHEVLHNWWGNGVYPDWARGNWTEGLTTFLADYAYKEDEGEAAARAMRLGWLRDLAAVPESEDRPLSAFTARRHGVDAVLGYNKAAMVFLMLRDAIGREAFERGLKLLWQRFRFRTASWDDLARVWSEAAGRDLTEFFRQWVGRAGAPSLRLTSAVASDGQVRVALEQAGEPWRLEVPVGLRIYPDRFEIRRVPLEGARTTVGLPVKGLVQAVELDPDYRLWRRIDPRNLPPILRETFIAPRVALLAVGPDAAWQEAARRLAGRVLDHPPQPVVPGQSTGPSLPRLIIGDRQGVRQTLQGLGLPPAPPDLPEGRVRVWAGRDDGSTPYAVVSADSLQSLEPLQRSLPHYGRVSWLVYAQDGVAAKGVWPPRPERLPVAHDSR
ncbi:MAG: M1 family aminopeptidase [Thiobacillaceae bacterium]|nr:M1 family aminopeptidase [Thiobacillaceae bacterium]